MGLKFLSRRTSGLEHQIQEETLHLIEVFDSTKGEPIEPSFHIILSVSNVICALLFGYKFSIDDETFHQLIESIKFILQVGTSPWGNVGKTLLYNVFPWIMGHLPGPHQKAFGFAESLRSFALQEIGSHKKHES
ncbi:putative Cytochrome P450 2J5-like protein, partial [Naja naja]